MRTGKLQERIGREHPLVSQFPSGHPTTPKDFPARNRTMALLTDATVIVEADEQSGTLCQVGNAPPRTPSLPTREPGA